MVMKGRRDQYWCIRFWVRISLFSSIVVILFTHCDARKAMLLSKDVPYAKNPNIKHLKILDVAKNLNMVLDVSMKDSSDPQPYVSSPFTLPPYDSLSPIPLPDINNNDPPYCVYPPPQQSPSTTMPNPIGYTPTPPTSSPNVPLLSPPPSPTETVPSPPSIFPSPPDITPEPPVSFPSPSVPIPNPPFSESSPTPNPPFSEPSPPSGSVPNPPEYVPSPIGFAPSPPVFQPPVVFPPPTTRTPPSTGRGGGGQHVWCVAKPSVPDPILQEAMNYACGSGADCSPIQPNGPCYQPDTLLAHTSYAFNSYWQRTKVAGGTCEFGGTAILVTVDPSSGGCKFVTV